MLHSAPRVVNRGQYSEYTIVGRFAAAAIANASPTRNATSMTFARIPPIRDDAEHHRGDPRHPDLIAGSASPWWRTLA